MYVDYNNNNLVNLACSILKHFDAEYDHNTLKEVDDLLENQYNNIIVLLLDGLGVDAVQYHLEEDGFFRRNMIKEYSSVFPPTTTAATTTIESGLTPIEHGWLGWDLYFKEIDKIVQVFTNKEKDKKVQVSRQHIANSYLPYKTIYEKIKSAGKGNAYSVSHFGSNRIGTFNELTTEVKRLCETPEKKYIYAYWEYPDCLMHNRGSYSSFITENIKELEHKVKKMCKGLSDTLLIITADHGHRNTDYYVLSDYPELFSMLKRPTSIEARATAFYIKDENLDNFPIEFKNNFADEFLLY